MAAETNETKVEKKLIKELIKSLESKDVQVREVSEKELSRLGNNKDVISALKEALQHDAPREPASRVLINIGEPVIDILTEKLIYFHDKATIAILEILPAIKSPRTMGWLSEYIQKVSDNDRSKVQHVVKVLGDVGETALEPLSLALQHKNSYIRLEAIRSLGRVGGDKASEILIKTLRNETDRLNVKEITEALIKLRGVKTGERGECPYCGTPMGFWDAKEIRCYRCEAYLRVENGTLVENAPYDIASSPIYRVMMNYSPNIYWPNCCNLCLKPVTDADYYKLEETRTIWAEYETFKTRFKNLTLKLAVPYCTECRQKVKKLFSGEGSAVAFDFRVYQDEFTRRDKIQLYFSFRNARYSALFRQANRESVKAGVSGPVFLIPD